MDVLEPMYDKVEPGGFIIIDDYGAIPACKEAVHDFRNEHGINDPIEIVDWTGAYWRKS
jgi:O-methyltransferase